MAVIRPGSESERVINEKEENSEEKREERREERRRKIEKGHTVDLEASLLPSAF
jgi:hypothetical protein